MENNYEHHINTRNILILLSRNTHCGVIFSAWTKFFSTQDLGQEISNFFPNFDAQLQTYALAINQVV